MYIHIQNMFRPELKYVPFGTIGYVKTNNNEVRQCKCVGAKLVPKENGKAYHYLRYEWKVAGIKEHQFGSVSRITLGIIYTNEKDAQRGASSHYSNAQIGEITPNVVFPIYLYLKEKYGMSNDCFNGCGTFCDCFHIKTYASYKDNTTGLKDTDFDVIIDENGIDCRVPMLDGAVDGIRRYPTAEKAYASMKPLKTYTLDEDDDVKPTTTKIKVTIEVEIDNIDNVKKYATILE